MPRRPEIERARATPTSVHRATPWSLRAPLRAANIARTAGLLLFSAAIAAGCFAEPSYEGRPCEVSTDCPQSHVCRAAVCELSAPEDDGADDAGAGSGPPPPSMEPGVLIGERNMDYITDTGVVSIPVDLRDATVAALVRDPRTGVFSTRAGAGTNDGRFVIPGIPGGEVYVRLNRLYVISSDREFDLSEWRFGRINGIPPGQPTNLLLRLSNLEPWVMGDELQYFVPNASAFDLGLSRIIPLAPGDTSMDAPVPHQGNLVDSAQGDVAYFTQMSQDVSSTGQSVKVLRRLFIAPGLRMEDGRLHELAGAFSEVAASKRATFRVCGSALAVLGARVNPAAVLQSLMVGIDVNPLASEHTLWIGRQPLLSHSGPTGGVDVDVGTVLYGNPYPASWPEYATVIATYAVPAAPGRAASAVNLQFVGPVSALSELTCTPRLGPPERPTLNGVDAFGAWDGVSETPTFRWDAPREGRPSVYDLEIYEALVEGEGPLVAYLRTAANEVVVPPGVLVSGKRYGARLWVSSDEVAPRARLQTLRLGLFASQGGAQLGTFAP